MEIKPVHMKHIATEESWGFDRKTIDYIQNAAAHGLYEIRGLGAKRRVPHFDDLLFLGASLSRYPLEGYREKCVTKTVLGTRFAKKPIELAIPITVAGMSFGALSANVKESLGRAATELGTSTTTGDGGMTPEERQSSKTLVYQCLPSRYGFNPDDVRKADAIEVVIGQGAKPGGAVCCSARRSRRAWPKCAHCQKESISVRHRAIPTGQALTTCRSRFSNCAR